MEKLSFLDERNISEKETFDTKNVAKTTEAQPTRSQPFETRPSDTNRQKKKHPI